MGIPAGTIRLSGHSGNASLVSRFERVCGRWVRAALEAACSTDDQERIEVVWGRVLFWVWRGGAGRFAHLPDGQLVEVAKTVAFKIRRALIGQEAKKGHWTRRHSSGLSDVFWRLQMQDAADVERTSSPLITAVQAALSQLGDKQRSYLEAVVINGMRPVDVAECFGVSVSTVMMGVRLASQRFAVLARQCGAVEGEPTEREQQLVARHDKYQKRSLANAVRYQRENRQSVLEKGRERNRLYYQRKKALLGGLDAH